MLTQMKYMEVYSMKMEGNTGIGNILKTILQICFWAGIIILIIIPFVLQEFGLNIKVSSIIAYPNGTILLIMIHNFIKLFDSVKNNNPFCDENVQTLKWTSIVSLVGSLLWIVDIPLKFIITNELDTVYVLTLLFLAILYIGVSISLYILSELFKKATEYKKENELTI